MISKEFADHVESIGKAVSFVCTSNPEVFRDMMEMGRLFDDVYCLSSRACAESIDQSARKIAAARLSPAMDTYTEVMEKAVAMLARGDGQAEVIRHFDMMVEKEYGR
jgi:hypothetical protein